MLAGIPSQPRNRTALETLAGALHRTGLAPGQVLIREGENGDPVLRYRRRRSGGLGGRAAAGVRGRGPGLGEIALLRRVPRTATITAIGPVTLFALDSVTLLAAVSGHAPTRRHADQIAADWPRPTPPGRPVTPGLPHQTSGTRRLCCAA
jgi:CRP-like cAMP-binding protein